LPWRRDTSQQVAHFLRHGHFDSDALEQSFPNRQPVSTRNPFGTRSPST
jgi:hypothetical protein